MSRHGLKPAMKYRGLTFYRDSGHAFQTPEWASGFEPHIAPSFWHRVRLFFKRHFA